MVGSVKALLGNPDSWDTPERLRLGRSGDDRRVWSIGVRYQSVENVIARYRAERLADGHQADADRPEDVRRFIEASGGAEGFALRMRNRQRTSSRNGILKAEAVLHEARILEAERVAVPADLAGAGEERLHHLRARWSAVPGQASGDLLAGLLHARRSGRGQARPHDPPLRGDRPRALGVRPRSASRRHATWSSPPRSTSASRLASSTTPSGPIRARALRGPARARRRVGCSRRGPGPRAAARAGPRCR